MAIISTVVYISSIVVFFFGQLLRLNILGVSLPLLDILIVLSALLNLAYHFRSRQFNVANKWFLWFLVLAWTGLGLNLWLRSYPPITPLFYLIRLTALLSFFIIPPRLPDSLRRFFHLILFANVIFGLIQYCVWPDFTYFSALDWDPHLYRLVSTFFDPTFTALVYLFLLLFLYLQSPQTFLQKALMVITYLALALTYSRSTFLAFVITFSLIGLKRKHYSLIVKSLLVMAATLILLPRPSGEGVRLERSSSIKAKIENYREGLSLSARSPIIGYGYNTLAHARRADLSNHAANGFDGSLLTILAATGLPGLILFITGINRIYRNKSIYYQSILLSVLIHSLFANSLLYPWILFYLALNQPDPQTS